MTPIKVGVIGCGVMGGFHAKQYKNIPDVELIGVSDADPSKKIEGLQFYTDYNDLLEKADVVTVATPTFTHFAVASAALEAGCSVLIEKPIALNVEEGKALIKKAKDRKLLLSVGHIERFNPAFIKLQSEVKNKKQELLDIKRCSPFPQRIADVSCVIDMMIHDIDLALKLIGSEVKHINAMGSKVKTNRLDKAQATLVFKNGTIATIEASRVHDDKVRTIYAASGNTVYDADLLNKALTKYEKGNRSKIEVKDHDQLQHELKDFISAVIKNKKPSVTGEDALSALDIAEKIEELALRLCS